MLESLRPLYGQTYTTGWVDTNGLEELRRAECSVRADTTIHKPANRTRLAEGRQPSSTRLSAIRFFRMPRLKNPPANAPR
jgi:hypothetical protein